MRRDEHPTKRENPSGEVRWVARYTDRDGKRRSAGTYAKEGPCRKPARDGSCCARHAILHAYENDVPAEERPPTVREYSEDTWLQRHPRTRRTEINYRGAVQNVLAARTAGRAFGDIPVREVRPRHLDDIVDKLLRAGRAASGTRAVMATLSAMFRDAIRDDVAEMNPASYVSVRDNDPRVQTPKRKRIVVPWEDMHRFAAAAGAHEAMIRTLADCGLRRGELLALERRHVLGDELVVEQTIWRGVVTPGTKSGDRRVAPIPPGLRAILDAIPPRIDTTFLFPDERGNPWSERSFYAHIWHPTCERMGMAVLPHDFRHSFVSLMRAAGVDPADLASATGHTVMTATNHYTHSTGSTFELMRRVAG